MPDFIQQARLAMTSVFPVGNPAELESYARRLDSAAHSFASTDHRFVALMADSGLNKGPLAVRMHNSANLFSQECQRDLVQGTHRLAEDVRAHARHLRSSQEQWKSTLNSVARRLEREFNDAKEAI